MLLDRETNLFINLLKDLGLFSFVDENKKLFYEIQKKGDCFLKHVIKISEKQCVNNNMQLTHKNYTLTSNKNSDLPDNTFWDVISKNNNPYKALKDMDTLEEVKDFLNNFQEISLAKTAINTVFGIGNPKANLLMIGEAPGAEEDVKGEPFVGRSGQLLTKALYSVGIHRENIFITNSVFWRPPGNRNPTSLEVSICKPFLQKIISLIRPKMILIVGKVAATTLLGEDTPIGKIRGTWLLKEWGFVDDIVSNIHVRVIYHPAYLLRNPKQKKVFWIDLLEISNKILQLNLTV